MCSSRSHCFAVLRTPILLLAALATAASAASAAPDSPLANSVVPTTGPSGPALPRHPQNYRFWSAEKARPLGACRNAERHPAVASQARQENVQRFTVVDDQGRAVPDVEVKVALAKAAWSKQYERKHACLSLIADDSGEVEFSVLRPRRNYVVEFHSPGYESVAVTLLGAARSIREDSHLIRLLPENGAGVLRRITITPETP